MSERPILFSTDMVRAILDGRKTVTRRLIRPQPKTEIKSGMMGHWSIGSDVREFVCPYGVFGDKLWVRETWCNLEDDDHYKTDYIYKADELQDDEYIRWRPSIHMPRTVARLFLRVIDVRAERLQDITEEDAAKEGCTIYNKGKPCFPMGSGYPPTSGIDEMAECVHRASFCWKWNECYDKRGFGWDANPWVFRIEFERIKS